MRMRYSFSPLARNAGWLLMGQGTGLALQAVYFVVVARLLGVKEYGIFVGAFALTGLVAQYSALGTGTVLLRYVSGNRSLFAAYWGNVLVVTTGVSALLFVLIGLLGKYCVSPASASLLMLSAAANCLCAQLTVETARVFQAFEKMRLTALLNLLTNLMRMIAALAMLVVMHHASARQWAVAATVVSSLSAAVAIGTVTVHFGWPTLDQGLFHKHWAEGVEYAFATSSASIYNDLDKTMLSHYGMNAANGIYTMAYRVIDIATMPVISIRDAAMPRLFSHGRNGMAAASELSNRLLKRALLVGLFVTIVLFIASPLVPRILGRGFADSAEALRWLCLIPLFRSVHLMAGSALTGAGMQRLRTTSQLTAAIVNFLLNLWLIPEYGWHGAAWSSLATDGALSAMNWGMLVIITKRAEVNTGRSMAGK